MGKQRADGAQTVRERRGTVHEWCANGVTIGAANGATKEVANRAVMAKRNKVRVLKKENGDEKVYFWKKNEDEKEKEKRGKEKIRVLKIVLSSRPSIMIGPLHLS